MNDTTCEITEICADLSYNRGHIGCAVLSMSKRIMNEIFDIATDKKINIYYTDTDSMHLDFKNIHGLEKEYKKRYNKELNGKQLEQFHTDFELKDSKGDKIKKFDIYATKSIFLGKKSYLDVLESIDDKGVVTEGYHIRLKGITKEGLEHEAKKYYDSYEGLYEDLAKGTQIEMSLNPFNEDEHKEKVMFELKKGVVTTRKLFTRKVKF
jgi:hypothetical protein